MEKATVRIAYDGPAVKGGVIGARELGPALLAISDLLEDANATLNGQKSTVRVNIRSGFEAGSFTINIEVLQTILDAAQTVIGVAKFYSPAELLDIIGFYSKTGISFIKLMKWLQGREVRKTTIIDTKKIRLETDTQYDCMEVTPEILRLYNYPPARRSVRAVMTPLDSEGIDTFETLDEKSNVIESIPKEEVPYFDYVIPENEEMESSESRGVFQLVDISFEEGRKWRISDGTTLYTATLLDKKFTDRISNGEIVFANGDTITAIIRRRQYRTEKTLRSVYEIVEVIDHQAQAPQISINLPTS